MRGRITVAFLFSMLILSGSLAASCPQATRQIYLAAVTGENSGGVFQLQVETRPGNGTVYTAIAPRTGSATQESEEIAAAYAFSSTGISQNDCDVLYTIKGPDKQSTVDGPSAGGAMAVATRAALLGKRIRQDVVMTGTISADGRIGEVGGIIEKAIASSEAGAEYFLSPKLQVYEALLTSTVSSPDKFRTIEIQTVQDAEKIILSDYSKNFSASFSPKSKPIPKILNEMKMDAELGRFALVAARVVDTLEGKVKKATDSGAGAKLPGLEKYFTDEISKARSLISYGYPFTAANSAFLLAIDAEYVKISNSKLDMAGSLHDVKACVSDLKKPAKTSENFHWAIGADLRRDWATRKIKDVEGTKEGRDDYSELRDLLFAYSWCGISSELASQANDLGGKPADETLLADMASEKLAEASHAIETSSRPDYDSLWHLQSGLDANKSGDFGAAIYEATYAKTMQTVSGESVENIGEATKKLLDGGRKSLWGKIYYGQGVYLYTDATEGKFSPSDAYRILRYSTELDKVSSEIDAELVKKKNGNGSQGTGGATGNGTGTDESGQASDAPFGKNLAFAAVIFALVFLLGGITIGLAKGMNTGKKR